MIKTESNQNADCIYKTCCNLPSIRQNLFCSTYDCHYHRDLKPPIPVRPTLRYIAERKAWRRRHEKTMPWAKNPCRAKSPTVEYRPKVFPHGDTSNDFHCDDRGEHHQFPAFCVLPEPQWEEKRAKEKRRRHFKEKEISRQTEKDLLREFQNMNLKPKSKTGTTGAHWAIQKQISLEKKFDQFADAYSQRTDCPKCTVNESEEDKQAFGPCPCEYQKSENDPLLPANIPSYKLSLTKTPFNYSTRLRRLTDHRPASPPRDPHKPRIIRTDALGASASVWDTMRSDRRRIRKRHLVDGRSYKDTCFWQDNRQKNRYH